MEIEISSNVPNCYRILNVAVSASEDDIRRAYKRLALKLHPDRMGNSEGANHNFFQIQRAYEVLRDPILRHYHDMELALSLTQEEYLNRFQDLILTASGLGLRCQDTNLRLSTSHPLLAVTQTEHKYV
eukprot:TRINITY_DN1215_c0_g1_i2.p2 TRINITY_DN1215_c0_g1~~TRINITY_DN1215_c0_g1_i2.p2  ORF type:complete len:128 (-),score=4.63 TRINITY_DN1215_c0_g1_i2:531-914(-)